MLWKPTKIDFNAPKAFKSEENCHKIFFTRKPMKELGTLCLDPSIKNISSEGEGEGPLKADEKRWK